MKERVQMAMFGSVVNVMKTVLGTSNDAKLKKFQPVVNGANTLEPELQALDDKDLRVRSAALREKLEGESLSLADARIEAFALAREAADRRIGMWAAIAQTKDGFDESLWGDAQSEVNHVREKLAAGESSWDLDLSASVYAVVRNAYPISAPPFRMRAHDVQLVGASVLNEGSIAEMKTGEGKTLVASLAAYLNGLTGRGVHIITVNDYLAQRDAAWNEPTLRFLGVSIGAIYSDLPADQRKDMYSRDVTYGTNNEFGFDYLRDNLKQRLEDQVQTRRNFAIVDEVDSVLIDEARTPLIISGPTNRSQESYMQADLVAKSLEVDVHFEVDIKDRHVTLTEEGVEKAAEILGVDNLYGQDAMHLPHYVDNAMKAHYLYFKDKEYLVHNNGIAIVDEFTGRMMSGRRWSDGLHQAIEAKEGVAIQEETQTYATITLQNLFRMYEKLSGMTGTALTEAQEFNDIYKLETLAVPTNRPVIRRDMPDFIYGTEKEKFNAIADEVQEISAVGQPVLVGTISVEVSESLSELLKRRGVKHNVLNARQHQREADIVKNAGQLGGVTIATNMAGRGTDIVLGYASGKSLLKHWQKAGIAPKKIKIDSEDLDEAILGSWAKRWLDEKALEQTKGAENTTVLNAVNKERKSHGWDVLSLPSILIEKGADMRELGGLRIIGTERHESRRIDNQLRGRSGRQGDRGSSRFFLSLDDDLMKRFAPPSMANLMRSMGLKDGMPIESGMVSRSVEKAQKRVEESHYGVRKNLLEYDEVMNMQRRQVYAQRQRILSGTELEAFAYDFFSGGLDEMIQDLADDGTRGEELAARIGSTFEETTGLPAVAATDVPVKDGGDACRDYLMTIVKEQSIALRESLEAQQEGAYEHILRSILLDRIDQRWKDHLYFMDHLRHSIGLESYGQKDPKMRYKEEGFHLFTQMSSLIRMDITRILFRVRIEAEPAPAPTPQARNEQRLQQGGFVSKNNVSPLADLKASGPAGPRMQPGPNDPCPCGSGDIYKNCHGHF